MKTLCRIDDKFVPLHRILWISAVPHFCGADDCQREGYYEVQLEHNEVLWASAQEQSSVIQAIEAWQDGDDDDDDSGLL